ncbi:hypothetical protein C8R44DRAFT_724697 [Mycena epipterygia]|nr:hypothetical protein C8R44DRAFT_724697 [Mycena epipterygia]
MGPGGFEPPPSTNQAPRFAYGECSKRRSQKKEQSRSEESPRNLNCKEDEEKNTFFFDPWVSGIRTPTEHKPGTSTIIYGRCSTIINQQRRKQWGIKRSYIFTNGSWGFEPPPSTASNESTTWGARSSISNEGVGHKKALGIKSLDLLYGSWGIRTPAEHKPYGEVGQWNDHQSATREAVGHKKVSLIAHGSWGSRTPAEHKPEFEMTPQMVLGVPTDPYSSALEVE